jgi:hypothetical protein
MLTDQVALAADTTIRTGFSYGGSASNAGRWAARHVPSGVNQSIVFTGTGTTNPSAVQTVTDFSGRHVVRGIIGASQTIAEVDGVAGSPTSIVPATGTDLVRMGTRPDTLAGYWNGTHNTILVTLPLTTAQASLTYAFLNTRK